MEDKTLIDLENIAPLLETVNLSTVGSTLVNKGILSDHSLDEYLSAHQRNEKWHYPFLLEIVDEGEKVIKRFLKVLIEFKYEETAISLQSKLCISDVNENKTANLGVTNAIKGLTLNNIASNNGEAISFIDEVETDGLFSCCTAQTEVDNPDVYKDAPGPIQIKMGKKFYAPDKNLRIYPMGSKPKGYALVIINQDFPGGLYDPRFGAGKDQHNLLNLFGGLGYSVYDYFNKTSMEMRQILRKFSRLPDHAQMDSCIVAISSHGERNRVVGTDNECVWMEDILDMFNNENCPLLKNKPKLFFVQACRGDKYDAGIDNKNVADGGRTALSNKLLLQPTQRSASWTDMVVAYSTIPEYVALRNVIHGSWFIMAVTQVFMEHAWNTPLSRLFQMVTELMETYEDGSGDKQVPEIVHRGWKRDLYFNPGLYSMEGL